MANATTTLGHIMSQMMGPEFLQTAADPRLAEAAQYFGRQGWDDPGKIAVLGDFLEEGGSGATDVVRQLSGYGGPLAYENLSDVPREWLDDYIDDVVPARPPAYFVDRMTVNGQGPIFSPYDISPHLQGSRIAEQDPSTLYIPTRANVDGMSRYGMAQGHDEFQSIHDDAFRHLFDPAYRQSIAGQDVLGRMQRHAGDFLDQGQWAVPDTFARGDNVAREWM